MRPGLDPQACRVPTRRGIYLFSMIVDTLQVRSTATMSLSPCCLCCRACLVALQPARLCLTACCTHLTSLQHTDAPWLDTCPQVVVEKRGTHTQSQSCAAEHSVLATRARDLARAASRRECRSPPCRTDLPCVGSPVGPWWGGGGEGAVSRWRGRRCLDDRTRRASVTDSPAAQPLPMIP